MTKSASPPPPPTYPVSTTHYEHSLNEFSFMCPGCQNTVTMGEKPMKCQCGVTHTVKRIDITVESIGECSLPTQDLVARYSGDLEPDLKLHRAHMGKVT